MMDYYEKASEDYYEKTSEAMKKNYDEFMNRWKPFNIPENPLNIQPIEYKVLVKLDEVQTCDVRYKGVIIIPETSQFIPQLIGTLVAVGGKAFEDFGEPAPRLGDKVLFNKHAGAMVQNGCKREEDWRILNDKDLNAILKEE